MSIPRGPPSHRRPFPDAELEVVDRAAQALRFDQVPIELLASAERATGIRGAPAAEARADGQAVGTIPEGRDCADPMIGRSDQTLEPISNHGSPMANCAGAAWRADGTVSRPW